MYNKLKEICSKPSPFSVYTAEKLWNDPHISKQMLKFHVDPNCDAASRNKNHIDKTVAWISSKFEIDENKTIADFGCGPGLYSIEFAKTGAQVTGIDFSKRSIEYAREQAASNGLKIDYIYENYLDYKPDKKFDLIILIYLDYCVLSPQQRKQLLSVFYNSLDENGSIMLDVLSINAYTAKNESSLFEHNLMNGFWSANEYYGFQNCFKYDDQLISLDKYSIVENTGMWHVYNWFQYFSVDTIKEELMQSNFKVTEIFSDTTGQSYRQDSNEFVVICEKI